MRALVASAASVLALAALASGCTTGRIYTHITEPLDVDFDATPVQPREARGDVKRVRYQFVDVQWDSNAIGDIAREHGFEEVYYADLETLSLFGIWTQRIVHIFGRATSDDPDR